MKTIRKILIRNAIGGMTWNLTPEEKQQYLSGQNQITDGIGYYWLPKNKPVPKGFKRV